MSTQSVRTRRIHYLSGFDPRGPAHYLRLYREEAQRQAAQLEAEITVGGRKRVAGRVSAWQIEASWGEQAVATDYQFMHWDDIIRKHWEPSRLRLVGHSFGMYLAYIRHGALGRFRRSARGAFYSVVAPLAFIVLTFVTMGVLAALGWLASTMLGAHPAVGAAMAAAGAALAGWGGLWLADRAKMFWLLRIFRYVFTLGRDDAELDQRLDDMAAHILAEQARDPVDEVLIVGHSVGTILAVRVLARVLAGASAGLEARLSLLTLGQCIPLLGYMPGANSFRADLAAVTGSGAVPWFDVTAAADPLCFFDVDPVSASGLGAPVSGQPTRVSARFFRMFHPQTYRQLRRDKLRLHFQYLMASEIPSSYDFFRITAGPHPLTAQF